MLDDSEQFKLAKARRLRIATELVERIAGLGTYRVDEVAPHVADLLEEFIYEFVGDEE